MAFNELTIGNVILNLEYTVVEISADIKDPVTVYFIEETQKPGEDSTTGFEKHIPADTFEAYYQKELRREMHFAYGLMGIVNRDVLDTRSPVAWSWKIKDKNHVAMSLEPVPRLLRESFKGYDVLGLGGALHGKPELYAAFKRTDGLVVARGETFEKLEDSLAATIRVEDHVAAL